MADDPFLRTSLAQRCICFRIFRSPQAEASQLQALEALEPVESGHPGHPGHPNPGDPGDPGGVARLLGPSHGLHGGHLEIGARERHLEAPKPRLGLRATVHPCRFAVNPALLSSNCAKWISFEHEKLCQVPEKATILQNTWKPQNIGFWNMILLSWMHGHDKLGSYQDCCFCLRLLGVEAL
jgi:hypothetical protein